MGRLRSTKKSDRSKRDYRLTEPRQVNTSINRVTHRAASRISTKVANNRSLHSEARNYQNEVQNSTSSASNIGSNLNSRNTSTIWREDFDIETANQLTALADIYYNTMAPFNLSKSARRRRNRLRRRNRRNSVRDDDYFPVHRRRFSRTQYARRVPRREPMDATEEANLLSSLVLVTSSLRGTLLTLHRIKNLMEKRLDNIDDILSTHNSTNTTVTQRRNTEKFNPNIKVKREIDVIEVKSTKSVLGSKQIKQEKNEEEKIEEEKIEEQQSEHQQPEEEPKLEDCPEN